MALPALATIPDEILEEIFLRLPTPAAVACASAACTSFRRVIKGRAFRRRFRSLHLPPLVGFMDAAGFHPAEAPHPSAPLAGALAPCAADYSFVPPVVSSSSYESFELDGDAVPRWRPRDVRDGRVLLDWISLHPRVVHMWSYPEDGSPEDEDDSDISILMNCTEVVDYHAGARPTWAKRERCNAADFHLAVCDPLFRRYVLLPTIPEDLAAHPQERLFEFEPMLAPTTASDGEDESLKVICIARYQTKLAIFVFTSTTRKWRLGICPNLPPLGNLSCFDCVRGCFYWTERRGWSDGLLVLDTHTMAFSGVDLLTGYHVQLRDLPDEDIARRRPSAVVVGREGVLEMFSLVCQHGSFSLHHTSLKDNSHEWKLDKIIPLPDLYRDYSICSVGGAEGFLFFRGAPQGIINNVGINNENVDCYSLNVKTYEITKVCSKMELFFNRKHALPYFSFPPLLLEPTI
ncbi:uncharacterized protein LOC124680273 [Lolium rigidum]|uniref:uncharacterized protein LOC124680273 n=1 Tax=Lolium rigidum TaxID=89674 RepID=UPI001F5D10D1|nr:uncharacterized protein LOC124680273 [Lolium rigidum]